MLQQWSRWNASDNYAQTAQVEVIYIDHNNQICLRVENTKDLTWARTENIILGWRPVIATKSTPVKKSKEPDVTLIRYWNYMEGTIWPSLSTPPNKQLPHYLKVTITSTDGKISAVYEPHSVC